MIRTLLLVLLALAPAESAALIEALRAPEAAARIEAARALAGVPGEEVSTALAAALAEADAAVCEAVLAALGGRKDAPSLAALRGALKRFDREPALLAAAVTALAASEDAASAATVAEITRRSLTADARLARACVDALGKLRAAEGVGCLVELLASPLAAEARESLAEATGLPFRDDATWKAWWTHARSRYGAAPLSPAPGAAEYRDDGWRFRIAVPDAARWAITRPAGLAARVLWRGPREEAVFAWVDVAAHAVAEGEPKTAEEQGARSQETMERELRETKEADYGRAARLMGEKAVRHEVVGILRDGRIARWRVFVVERNGILYTVSAGIESGAGAAARRELESILASLRLLDD